MEFYWNLCRFCSKFVWRKICVEQICVEKICVEKKWPNMQKTLACYANLKTYALPLFGYNSYNLVVEHFISKRCICPWATANVDTPVVFFHMNSQCSWLRTREIALSTSVRLFTCVNSFVPFQSIWPGGTVIALSAAVRFLTSVHSHVHFQCTRLSAGVITLRTAIWLLTGMHSHVPF